MQRFLSLATLAVIGGLGFVFLKGGGLGEVIVAPNTQSPARMSPRSNGPQSFEAWQSEKEGLSETDRSRVVPTDGPTFVDGPTIRIAAYNIQVFDNKKASKSHVLYTLAEVVRQFDVLALQGIRTQNQYDMSRFVEMINRHGRKYDYVIGPHLGDTTIKEQYVFLFDTARIEVDHQSVYTVSDPDRLLHRAPFVATFRTRGVDPDNAFTFTLVNTHTDPDDVQDELAALAEVYRVVRRSGREEDDIILLGDLNTDDGHLGRLGKLPGIMPLITRTWTNTRQDGQYDNLIIHQPSTKEYTGRAGVFDVMRQFNLTEEQALEVSDHFPVWGEFSVYERDHRGQIASHRRRISR